MRRPRIFLRYLYASQINRSANYPTRNFQGSLRYYASNHNIMQPSFWLNIIPKPLRPGNIKRHQDTKVREWNPWTFYIILLLLIGSNSIQMISIEKSYAAFNRKSDARIGLLQDVIKRIKNGEEVDVESILGTGNKEREQEWQDVLKDIEKDDTSWIESSKQISNSGDSTKYKRNSEKKLNNSLSNSQANNEKIRAPPGFF